MWNTVSQVNQSGRHVEARTAAPPRLPHPAVRCHSHTLRLCATCTLCQRLQLSTGLCPFSAPCHSPNSARCHSRACRWLSHIRKPKSLKVAMLITQPSVRGLQAASARHSQPCAIPQARLLQTLARAKKSKRAQRLGRSSLRRKVGSPHSHTATFAAHSASSNTGKKADECPAHLAGAACAGRWGRHTAIPQPPEAWAAARSSPGCKRTRRVGGALGQVGSDLPAAVVVCCARSLRRLLLQVASLKSKHAAPSTSTAGAHMYGLRCARSASASGWRDGLRRAAPCRASGENLHSEGAETGRSARGGSSFQLRQAESSAWSRTSPRLHA